MLRRVRLSMTGLTGFEIGLPSMNSFVGEPAFGIEGGFAAHAGGGDGLFVDGVGDVAGGEDAFDTGGGAEGVFKDDEAFGVGGELVVEEFGVGGVADGDEHAGGFDGLCFLGLDVFDADAGHAVFFVAEDFFDDAVPDGLDLGIGEDSVGHDLAGAEEIAAVDQVNLAGELGEVGALLCRRVSAADDDEGLVAEAGERAVADGAGADAAVFEVGFGIEAEVVGAGAGADDEGM